MSEHSLEAVLQRLRDGRSPSVDPAGEPWELARSLVAADERIPAELRESVFRVAEDAADDAAGLLAVLGADDLFAGIELDLQPDLEGPWMDDGWDVVAAALVDGVRAESAGVDVSGAVAAELGLAGVDADLLRDAVAEGGEVDLAAAVAAELGEESLPIAEAVRAEAGRVDLVPGVLAAIGVWRAESPNPVRQVARAANAGPSLFGFAGFGMAAAVLLAVVMGRLASPLMGEPEPSGIVFAKAGEVVVEELSTGSDVAVMQLEGDGGAVILWIDEEV